MPLSGSSRPRLAPSYRRDEAFFISSFVSSSHRLSSRLVSSPVSNIAGRGASCLVPPCRMKQGGSSRHPISSSYLIVPVRGYLVVPSHLVPSRSSSRFLVSSERLAVCHPVSSHQMRDKQARRQGRLGLVSVSSSRPVIRAAGGSSSGSRSVPVAPSSARHRHPRQANRRQRRGGLDDRIPANNGGQANQTRTADAPVQSISSNGLTTTTRASSHTVQHNRPAPTTSTTRRTDETPRQENENEHENDGQTTKREHTTPQDDKQATRHTTR